MGIMLRFFTVLLAFFALVGPVRASDPEILVLGDSQISFGAGQVYVDFFENLDARCNGKLSRKAKRELSDARAVALGVRSTSLHSWVAREGSAKGTICDVDRRYGVNAGAYGLNGNPKRKYVQIGRDSGVEYCAPGKSGFEGMFSRLDPSPKLLVLAFLGNAADRWAKNPNLAETDVRQTLSQIPANVPCVFMTTAPVYKKSTNDLRVAAQKNIARAFKGSRCKAIEALNPQIRAAVEGHARFFRRNEAGKVIDPHHPSVAATQEFVGLNTPKLCKAVSSAFK